MPLRIPVLPAACAVLVSLALPPAHAAPAPPSRAKAAPPSRAKAAPPPDRWVYVSSNLLVRENVDRVKQILHRARAAGYNGVLLADYKLHILDRVDDAYFRNARDFRAEVSALGLRLAVAVAPVGYSNGLLAHDPNLAEGLPARDVPFVVRGRAAEAEGAGANVLANPGFEAANGHRFEGWTYQDDPGATTFSDTGDRHDGGAALRMQDIGAKSTASGNARVFQTLRVAPFRPHRLTVWIKTEDFEATGAVNAAVLTAAGRPLAFPAWEVRRTQGWTRYQVAFNTLDNREVRVYLGVWGGRGGRIWWDDAVVEETGLLNVLRRDGCPLAVRGEDGTTYEEGRDFQPVRDERLGTTPWPGEYTIDHAPPSIRLTAGSRILDGQRLLASFHHVTPVHGAQVACCLSHPRVFALIQDEVQRVNRLLKPDVFFMSHDEIRVANWCGVCRAGGRTAGKVLADNVRRCAALIRAEAPRARIATWSDMFDPYHNARPDYYLVNGDLRGSWVGLDKDVMVANWNFGERAKSVPWFARRGHPQLLAGYYDGPPEQVRDWVAAAAGTPDARGLMYTTWQNRYEDLDAFARIAWGASTPQ